MTFIEAMSLFGAGFCAACALEAIERNRAGWAALLTLVALANIGITVGQP